MPRVSAFYGLIVMIYTRDHNPPHLHAVYSGYRGRVAIRDARLLDGWLPPRALRLLGEWIDLHQAELLANWERAQRQEPVVPIDPLP